MSTTMESMLQNNVLPPTAPACGNVERIVEEKEREEEAVPEKLHNDVEGGENKEHEDARSQSSFEDEMLRINEIVTSIQTESGEGESLQKNSTVVPPEDATNTQPPAEKKAPEIDMNALSQMKYGELQSFVKNRFGVMLRVNKLDLLKKVEEMAASA